MRVCHYDPERTRRCEDSGLSETEKVWDWKATVMNCLWEEVKLLIAIAAAVEC